MFSSKNSRFALGPVAAVVLAAAAMLVASCQREQSQSLPSDESADGGLSPPSAADTPPRIVAAREYIQERARMVTKQLAARDIHDQRVLNAMQRVPRHAFVAADQRNLAYVDSPLPIGHQQTISQPYVVALMTQLVEPHAHKKRWTSAPDPGIRRPCWLSS